MNRPKILHVGGTLYWVIRIVNPDTQVLKDADSTPTVAIRKNGASVGDSVTVTKRSATTGIYDCSYNPAGEVEGDEFTVEESATVTGTTTSSATYPNSWEFTVIAVERGTDSAATAAQATAIETDTQDIQSRILDAAGVRASIGMGSADMDTQLDAILAASGGGGDTVVVAPLVQTDSQRNTPAYIECNQYDVSTLGPFRVETATGGQFNFANQSDWLIVVWDKDDRELGVVAYNDIDFSSSTSNAVMDQYSFAPSAAQVATAGRHTFSIRRPRGTTEQAPIVGVFNVIRCPRGPA